MLVRFMVRVVNHQRLTSDVQIGFKSYGCGTGGKMVTETDFSGYFCLPLPVSFHQRSILIYSYIKMPYYLTHCLKKKLASKPWLSLSSSKISETMPINLHHQHQNVLLLARLRLPTLILHCRT